MLRSGGTAPLASRTCPDLSEPSGSVKDTISLYLGNLTCQACQPAVSSQNVLYATYIVKNDERTVDTANRIIPYARMYRRHSGVVYAWRHGCSLLSLTEVLDRQRADSIWHELNSIDYVDESSRVVVGRAS